MHLRLILKLSEHSAQGHNGAQDFIKPCFPHTGIWFTVFKKSDVLCLNAIHETGSKFWFSQQWNLLLKAKIIAKIIKIKIPKE